MNGPSTQRLYLLPTPEKLRALMQSIGLLEEILCDEWESRYYSYDEQWGNGEVASMRNGEGDSWFLWFGAAGIVLLGFAHEASPMTPYARSDRSLWPGLLTGFPKSLHVALEEPAFEADCITFAIWREASDTCYRIGPVQFPTRKGTARAKVDPDGSSELLAILDGQPETYATWASSYYDIEIDLESVRSIYERKPISQALVKSLRKDAPFRAIARHATSLGFRVEMPAPSSRRTVRAKK